MLILKDYKICETLHQGDRNIVYRAKRNLDNKNVILKTTLSEQPSLKDKAQIYHEYQILKDLDLPGIRHVIELYNHQLQPILVLEDIGGQTLRKFLDLRPLSLDVFFTIALQMIQALGLLHRKKVIHKDINPDNILVDPKDLSIHIIDFSISTKLTQEAQGELAPDNLEGTLIYMSPEQTGRLNRNIDYRSDYYSMGVTFYEMLTARPPFQAKDPLELIYSHLTETPPLITALNPEILEQVSLIISKLMAKSPEERYVSSLGIKADFEECLQQWNKNQKIKAFPLGLNDFHDYINISQKLYGRGKQVTQLLETFERVSKGSCELLLVSGYSGVGKTSVIKEVKKPIVQQRGYFVSGKFDQLQGTVPYSAFVEAFSELIHRLLSQSQDKVTKIKQSLIKALGSNAKVLIDVIPTLELVIGPQPAVPELNSAEAQNRFIVTFQNFVRTLAQREHPLVLFLDDWQWSDSASQRLLKLLLADEDLQYVFIIGAYRDNVVTPDHPFSITMQTLKQMDIKITELGLTPLVETDIGNLLSDTLNCPLIEVEPLAKMLLEKTQGNPFFINEFLKTLAQNGFLTFSYDQRKWEYDLEKINNETYTDNVVDFLISRIHALPEDVQTILKIASCIGHLFDIKILSQVSKQSVHEVEKYLWAAVEANFIIPIDDSYKLLQGITEGMEIDDDLIEKISYRFAHDRIQQASYELMDSDYKKQLHLTIGRLLRNNMRATDPLGYFVQMVNHLNQACDLIEDPLERNEIANFNLRAGQQTREANVYDLSLEYFLQGIGYLPASSWKTDYDLTFELYHGLSQSEYLSGNFDQAEQMFKLLLAQSTTKQCKIKVYLSMGRLYTNESKLIEAIQTAIEALKLLGHKLPFAPSKLAVIKELILVKFLLRGKTAAQILVSPQIMDENKLAIIKILDTLYQPAITTNPLLFALISLRIMSSSLLYGNSLYSASGYLGYAIILKGNLTCSKNNEDKAYEFGRLAMDLLEKHNAIEMKAKLYAIYTLMIHYRRNPFKDCIRYFKEGYLLSMESGNLVTAGFNVHQEASSMLLSGDSLKNIIRVTETAIVIVKKINDIQEMICLTIMHHFHNTLINDTGMDEWNYETFSESELIEHINEKEFFIAKATYNVHRGYYYYLMGDYDKAVQNYRDLGLIINRGIAPGIYSWIFYYFFYPLTMAGRFNDLPHKERPSCLKEIKKFLYILKSRATTDPDNHLNKYLLVSAEYARITNDVASALKFYTQSINIAQEQDLIHEQAIAHELFGKFYLEMGDVSSGHNHLRIAHYQYGVWGAKAKTNQLERLYPDIVAKSVSDYSSTNSHMSTKLGSISMSTEVSEKSLDLASILKASQAISGEIELDKLLDKLLLILLESAGAQRGMLITKCADNWIIEAESSGGKQKVYLTGMEKIEGRNDIALTLINYVKHTQEPLIIHNAGDSEHAELDPYLREKKPKSILILPVFYKGKLNNIIYLENNTMSNVFTEEKFNVLQFLASQAAISLENARLYYQAMHDPLTGLGNRNLLYQTFERGIRSPENESDFVGIIFADIDFFKNINDTMGHEVGDKVLIHLAEQLKKCIRDNDMVVRLGGDEFVVLLQGLKNKQQVINIADRIYALLSVPVVIQGHTILVSTSMGVSLYPFDGKDIETLLKNADIALYKVKEEGKNHYQFYARA